MEGIITKAFFDIHGRKYIDVEIDNKIFHIKIPFKYGRVFGCSVEGHVPIQDMPVGTRVTLEYKKVLWDGLEHYVLKRICPYSLDTENV
jgi:hypothetical protein